MNWKAIFLSISLCLFLTFSFTASLSANPTAENRFFSYHAYLPNSINVVTTYTDQESPTDFSALIDDTTISVTAISYDEVHRRLFFAYYLNIPPYTVNIAYFYPEDPDRTTSSWTDILPEDYLVPETIHELVVNGATDTVYFTHASSTSLESYKIDEESVQSFDGAPFGINSYLSFSLASPLDGSLFVSTDPGTGGSPSRIFTFTPGETPQFKEITPASNSNEAYTNSLRPG